MEDSVRSVKHINEEDFNIVIRRNGVILSAPHATKQIRDGKVKKCETKTKYIADKVAKKTNSCCIYKTMCLGDDANYDDYSYYREKCAKVIKEHNIKFLLDVHGMSAEREEDICIGIANGKNINGREDILENIIRRFRKNKFENVSVDVPFSSSGNNCVSSYIHEKCDIVTFQIEVNYKYLSSVYPEYDLMRVVSAFKDVVEYLKRVLNRGPI